MCQSELRTERFLGLPDHENGDITLLRNVGNYLPADME